MNHAIFLSTRLICAGLVMAAFTGCDDGDSSGDGSSDGGATGQVDESRFQGTSDDDACSAYCTASLACPADGEPQPSAEDCQAGCVANLNNTDATASRIAACAEPLADDCDSLSFAACVQTGPAGDALRFSVQFGKVVCGKQFECCPEGGGFFQEQSQCEGFIGGLFGTVMADAAAKGWVLVDNGKLDACLGALRSAVDASECGQAFADPFAGLEGSDCDQMFVPQQGEGDPCGTAGEDGPTSSGAACKAGLACELQAEGVPICTATAAVGEPCGAVSCEEGAFCDGESCAALKADGDACGDSDECVSQTCAEGQCAAEGGAFECGGGQ